MLQVQERVDEGIGETETVPVCIYPGSQIDYVGSKAEGDQAGNRIRSGGGLKQGDSECVVHVAQSNTLFLRE